MTEILETSRTKPFPLFSGKERTNMDAPWGTPIRSKNKNKQTKKRTSAAYKYQQSDKILPPPPPPSPIDHKDM